MMNKLNLIILVITVAVIICIGIYLYKNNKNNNMATKEAFYQASSQASTNPITIADMATTIADMATTIITPTVHEYAIFKMIGNIKEITNTVETPLYKDNSYIGTKYPSNYSSNENVIKISNGDGKIYLDSTKKYRLQISFNRQHSDTITKSTDLDLLINSYDILNTRIPAQSYGSTAYILRNGLNSINNLVTLNIFCIIHGVSYIIPLIRYRNNVTVNSNNITDTSTFILIETCD